MSLFKRSTGKLLIPPIESSSQVADPSDLNASRHKYSRSNGVGDVYMRPGVDSRQVDQDRNELFSGYNPAKSGSGRFFDGPNIDDGDDVEAIKQKTRFMKQESVNSTRNGLRVAREAVETGESTLKRLGEQSERLANTERHLDVAKGHSVRADDKTEELRKLNRSIFIPAVTFNKDTKRAAKEAKVQRRYEDERAEREKALMDIRETQDRLGRAQAYGSERMADAEGISGSSRVRAAAQAERGRFQFEANASDDDMENELDRNLGEIEGLVKNMRSVGLAMGGELDRQNERISVLDEKTGRLDGRLYNNTMQLQRAGGK
ncbi:hypothetical protein B0H10DRAFT_386973 [Mycena sp. CBHHK59/15]|nr:hypothetical protein B0H10DRAFT_386973 [Mycena sp. CBHHK59/15]